MLKSGLLSVTFRKRSAEEIVALAAQAGLQGLEWGGDIHVPHGDLRRASEVRRMTADAGLEVAAYGSYYRVGCDAKETVPFEAVLASAIELQAPTIRVWAGNRGSADADEAWRSRVVEDSRRIASLAEREGVTISFEYHGGTLTDTRESALRLLREADHVNIHSYWQPPVGMSAADRLEGLRQIRPWLSHVHVFYWLVRERRPLAEGTEEWLTYLRLLSQEPGSRYIMLEFVRDDDSEQFLRDAQTLRAWIDRAADADGASVP